ncbi:MAG: acyl-CoA dehydrogenase family protein, partial [Anaerolineaceae bacterium]
MTFDNSPELKMILNTMREFVREEIIPLERFFLNHDFEMLLPLLEEKRQKAKGLGLWLPQIPSAYGGMGLSLLEHGFVSEVLGQSPLGHYVFNCQAPDAGNMEILIEYGTAEQQDRFLKPLLAGETRSCFSMTEPENPGSNPTWMSSTAVCDGDEYVIEGHKWFTTAADGAAFAIVMAVTNPQAARHQRASMIIVPTDTAGFRIVENTSV